MHTVMTVSGALPAESLGLVLPHEHLFADTLREYRSDGLLNDEELVTRDVERFAKSGGGCIVELSGSEFGRDPEALRRVSLSTGIPIVMGCGHYRDPYLDAGKIDRFSAEELAGDLIAEITEGIGPHKIKPGIVGEVGCNSSFISAREERVLRACAKAQRATGLALTLHAARWPVARQMLPILEQEGVPNDRMIVGHLDTVHDRGYHLELASRGCFVEFDGFTTSNARDLQMGLDSVAALVEAGYLDNVLISHDLFRSSHFPEYGGVGLSFIPTVVRDAMAELGFSATEITTITESNPQRAIALKS